MTSLDIYVTEAPDLAANSMQKRKIDSAKKTCLGLENEPTSLAADLAVGLI